jgi:hypothetical protein
MTDPNSVDDTQLDKAQDAIDDAHEAAKKVADAEDIEVGDLPAFADSAADTEATNAFATGEGRQDSEA